jgi:hypothetical protein
MAKDEQVEDGEIEEKIMEAAKKADAKTKKEDGFGLDKKDDEEEEEEEEVETKKKSKKEAKKSSKDEEEEEEEVEEGELPPALKKAIAKKKKKDGGDDEKEEEDESKKSKKDEEIEVDVSEDVSALIDGEDLSEEFKTKAATIFEAAVKSKIAKIRKQIRDENKIENDERTETLQADMTEKMDTYLNYAIKEWMEENKLAVEQGVRNEVTESFISGLKKLFEEHYIDVPKEKEDVFESLVVENKELEEKLDEQSAKHMDTVKELNTYKAKDAFRDITDGMVDTDVEKMKELTEDVSFETDEQYREKLNVIKNSYFKSDQKVDNDNKETAATNKPVTDGTGDASMTNVLDAISKSIRK